MARAFLPSLHDLASLAAALLAAVLLALAGRACRGGEGETERDLAAGWGIACLGATLTGALGMPLYLGLLPLPPLAAWGWMKRRQDAGDDALRFSALACLPLLAVMAGVELWQSDAWSFWLPNYLYIAEHHAFPSGNNLPKNSYFYGFPYNLQLAAYAASPFAVLPKAMLHFNLLLCGAFILACARALKGSGSASAPLACAAVAAATLANPGFVPTIFLSSYGDAATAILLALCALQGLRVLEKGEGALSLALMLSAFVNVKQANIALEAGLFAGLGAIALLRGTFARYALRLLPACLPSLALYALWRWYAQSHLPESAENQLLPFAEWPWHALGNILGGMGEVMARKGGFFLLLAGVIAGAAYSLSRVREKGNLLILAAWMILFYNAFLIAVYVGWKDAGRAISYWRYSTHLGPLALLAALPHLAAWVRARPKIIAVFLSAPARKKAWAALFIAAPFLLASELRYDMAERKVFIRNTAAGAASMLPDGAHVAIVAEGYNKLDDYLSWRGVLLFHRPSLAAARSPQAPAQAMAQADAVLLSCLSPKPPFTAPAFTVALLRREGGEWKPARVWDAPKSLCERK